MMEVVCRSQRTLTVVVLLLVALQHQPVDASALPIYRREQQEQCVGMDKAWLDNMWSAYKEKYGRSYDAGEDAVRYEELNSVGAHVRQSVKAQHFILSVSINTLRQNRTIKLLNCSMFV